MLHETLIWLAYAALLVACVAGLFLNLLGLPGLWLIVVAAILYAWLTGFVYLGLWSIVALIAIGILAEIVEFVAGAAGSKKAGGSKRGMAGAIVGGLVGGIVGTGVIPVPVLGTVVGSVIGCFAGAYVIEWMIGRSHGEAAKISYGAAIGRVYGLVVKSILGCAMAAITAIVGLPVTWLSQSLPSPPTTTPAPASTLPVA